MTLEEKIRTQLMIPNKTICFKILLEYYVLKLYLSNVWFPEPTPTELTKAFVTEVRLLQTH